MEILALKNSVMLTAEQWAVLHPNARRNYIRLIYAFGAMACGDTKQLSYSMHLLDDDCDKIAERLTKNPIESKIYFKE